MTRPLSFRVTSAGTYLPVNRSDVSFATLNGVVMYLGIDCFLAKDGAGIVYLIFGTPDEAVMVPAGSVVGVHFSSDPEDTIEFAGEPQANQAIIEALERALNSDDETNNLDS